MMLENARGIVKKGYNENVIIWKIDNQIKNGLEEPAY